jgi:hypothetical protein
MGDQISTLSEGSLSERFSSFSETMRDHRKHSEPFEPTNIPKFFWKNYYHDEWFPIPAELQTILDSSPNEAFRFGIYLHNIGSTDVYQNSSNEYALDPIQLVLWSTMRVDTTKGFVHHLLLKKISTEGEVIGKAPFDFYDAQNLECKLKLRPKVLPKNPPCVEEPQEIDREEKLFYCIQNDQFMAYPPLIQSLLNKADRPLRFAIYDRNNWPELFGGSYREYIVDPKELVQLSVQWKQSRPLVMVTQQIAALEDTSKTLSIGSAKSVSLGSKLPQKYLDSPYTRIYRQDELNALATYAIPGVDVYYYILYACHLVVEDTGQYLDANVPHFARENMNWKITGAILRPDPEAPDVVMQYFEGPYKAVRQLMRNIQFNRVVTNFSCLGQGFLTNREFNGWGMKREASAKKTLEILKMFQEYEFVSRSQFKNAKFLQ